MLPGSGPGSGRAPGTAQKHLHVSCLVLSTETLAKTICFFLTFHSKVVSWLEVCVSSVHFTRSC